jgi:hypothetical protein
MHERDKQRRDEFRFFGKTFPYLFFSPAHTHENILIKPLSNGTAASCAFAPIVNKKP